MVSNLDVNILTVSNLDVDILTVGNLDVDILTVSNLYVDILMVGYLDVRKWMLWRQTNDWRKPTTKPKVKRRNCFFR
jgi:RNase P/RNase MRP subunit p30